MRNLQQGLVAQGAQPYDSASTFLPAEYADEKTGPRHRAVPRQLIPCCNAIGITILHAGIRHRGGAPADQRESLAYTVATFTKYPGVPTTVGDGVPFTAERGFRMNIILSEGEARDAPDPTFCSKGSVVNVTHADPQLIGYLQPERASIDGLASAASEARKNACYPRLRDASFDRRLVKRTTLEVDSRRYLERCGEELIDRVEVSMVHVHEGGGSTHNVVLLDSKNMKLACNFGDHAESPRRGAAAPAGAARATGSYRIYPREHRLLG